MTINGAPENNDIKLFEASGLLQKTTNCYAYAMQDYGAGLIDETESVLSILSSDKKTDYNYLPRPGQTVGISYEELFSVQPSKTKDWAEQRKKVMRLALKQDGILYQGTKYPDFVPDDKYVVCCFLEPNSYHFIRQNKDGSWTSKNGLGEVTDKAEDNKTPLGDNPEKFYAFKPDYPFVGYFFVPKGGIRIGLKSFLIKKNRINKLYLMQILQKQGQTQKFAPHMDIAQEHMEKAVTAFKEIYNNISHLRQVFLNLQTDSASQKKAASEVEEIEAKIKKTLHNANLKKAFELRSFLKNKQQVSSSRRSKILKSAER